MTKLRSTATMRTDWVLGWVLDFLEGCQNFREQMGGCWIAGVVRLRDVTIH